jgi:hypothetical protein
MKKEKEWDTNHCKFRLECAHGRWPKEDIGQECSKCSILQEIEQRYGLKGFSKK